MIFRVNKFNRKKKYAILSFFTRIGKPVHTFEAD